MDQWVIPDPQRPSGPAVLGSIDGPGAGHQHGQGCLRRQRDGGWSVVDSKRKWMVYHGKS